VLSRGIPRLTGLWARGRLQPRVAKLYHTLVAIDELCPSPQQVSPSLFRKLLRASFDQSSSRYRAAIEALLVDCLALGGEPCFAAWAAVHHKVVAQSTSLMLHVCQTRADRLDRDLLSATVTRIEQINATLRSGEFRDRKGRKIVQAESVINPALVASDAACAQLHGVLVRLAELAAAAAAAEQQPPTTEEASMAHLKPSQQSKHRGISSCSKWATVLILIGATGVGWAYLRCCDLPYCRTTVLPMLQQFINSTFLPSC
jgi:hypothetical protein